jgi:hypothetical protein
LKKRKEMREVDENLEMTKRDYIRRMEECEQRRLQFVQNQAKQREEVLKVEKFLQECEGKRQRAEAKAKAERKQYDEKCYEEKALEKQIVEMNEQLDNLRAELGLCHVFDQLNCILTKAYYHIIVKHQRYKDYLEKIVDGEYGYGMKSDL